MPLIDIERILKDVKARGAKRVALQYPEGLVREILGISDRLTGEGLEVILVGEPCHGACDVPDVDCDVLVQFGHAPISSREHVIFEEVPLQGDLAVLEKCVPLLKSPVGLFTTVQHVHQIPDIKRYLGDKGIDVLVGRGGPRVKYDGQVLGCDFSTALTLKDNVKSFLYFGSGDFHPLGVALATGLEVVAADPFSGKVRSMEELRERFLRQRYAAIELASDAESFGILVSRKSGQMRMPLARDIESRLRKAGKKAYVFLFDEVIPQYLEGYGLDCFVSTACPRLGIDDYSRFKKPVITPPELEIVLKEREWKDYGFDDFTGTEG
jgi:2-(3-amino-3-carboxypropyl)histidine synthase